MRNINWGVLGTAGIARKQTIPGMLEAEDCRLYAIAGRNPEKVQQFQTTFGFEKAYFCYEDLLSDPLVEAVYIPLPNSLHREWTLKALRAGKHVLCEKPLAPTYEEARELFEAAKQAGVLLMEAFAYLHSPYLPALRQDLERIGGLTHLEAAFLTGTPRPDNIRMDKSLAGGSQYDLGCYCTSLLTALTEEEPCQVKASSLFDDQGIDLVTTALVAYPSGATACLRSGMCLGKEGRYDSLYIRGPRGCIRSDVCFNQPGELRWTVETPEETEEHTVTALQNYRLEVESLNRFLVYGETPAVTPEFSLRNARLMDAILHSAGY